MRIKVSENEAEKKRGLLFQAMVENSDSIIVLLNENFQPFYRSSSAEKISGWTHKEIDAIGSTELTHPDDRELVKEVLEASIKNPGKLFPLAIRGRHKNGGYVWLEGTAINLLHDENINAIMTNFRDVTEQKKAEEIIRQNEAKYRSVVENMHESLIVEDNDGKLIYANKEFTKIFGFTAEEFDHLSLKDYTSPESFPEIVERHNNRINGLPVAEDFIYKGKRKDGAEIWIEARVSSIFENGKIIGTQSLERDITARKNAEEKLRASEQARKLIMDSALDAIISMNDAGIITFWTQQSEKLFGWSADEVIGKTVSETIIPERDRARHINGLKQYAKTGEGYLINRLIEVTAIDKQGREFPVEMIFARINQDGVGYFCAFIRDITERKLAEKKIKESELRYRSLIEQASDAIMVTDFEGNFIDVNESMCKLSGYSNEELIGKNVQSIMEPEHLKERPFNLEHEKAGKQVFNERKIIHKNKTIIEVEANVKKINDNMVLAIVRDITERKLAEEKIRESEMRYRSLIEQASDSIMVTDFNGNFVDANETMCSMFGYTKEELLALNISKLIDPEQLKVRPVNFDRLKSGQHIFNERRMMHKNGSIIEVEANVKKITDELVIAIARDITERKHAQEKIKLSEEKFRNLFERNLAGVFHSQPDGKMLTCNDAYAKILGYSSIDELLQTDAHEFYFSNSSRNEFIALLREKGEVLNFELLMKRKDGLPVYIVENCSLQKDKITGEEIIEGVLIDITERKNAEEKIKKQTEQLRNLTSHLQTVREEERLNMAHEIHDELGQQLTIVKMNLYSLMKKYKNISPEFNEQAELVGESINKTVNTVRKIASELRPVMLDEQGLDDALRLHTNEFSKQTGIPCNFTSENIVVIEDINVNTQVFRIFQESLTNVARHANASHVNATMKTENGFLKLMITDNGNGFNPEKNVEKKSLGLVMMRERATSIYATLQIISEPNQGTSVLLTVPLKTQL